MANDNDTTYVRLITSNNYGCKNDTIVKRFITIQDPQADFTLSDSIGCGNTQITLSDASTPSGLALNWSFGDGDSSTATNPTHTFNNTSNTQDSTYNITLIAKAGTGCSDTITKSITIHPLPKALFTLSSAASCAPATITSTNTSAHKTGAWSSLWTSSHASVGINNTTDSTPTFSFVDNDSGVDTTYTLSLLVTSIDGCKDSISDTLRVYSRPNAIFSIDTGSCGGLSLTPDNNTDTSSVFGHDYLWTINPSSGVTLDDTLYEPSIFMPVNNTTSAISYTILLTATSPQGCVDTYLDSTIVYPKPLASFSYALPDSCSPDTAYFTNTSNPYNSEAITSMNFLWDFGSTLQDPNKLYTNTGILDSVYLIELISESMHGCKDTFVDSITIHPDARADFNPTSSAGCAPLTLDSTLIGLTQYPLANDTYSWTIFASNSSTVLSSFNGTSFTSYTMANDNDTTYVRLITSNNYGCKNDTIVKRFITIQDPQADFTLSDSTGCGNTQITLSDASTASEMATLAQQLTQLTHLTIPLIHKTLPITSLLL
jgi:ribosomal protein S27E